MKSLMQVRQFEFTCRTRRSRALLQAIKVIQRDASGANRISFANGLSDVRFSQHHGVFELAAEGQVRGHSGGKRTAGSV